jgi:hypothetical protein
VGYLNASLQTGKLRGSVGRGISVYTNDPQKAKLRLTIRAEVLSIVTLLPREIMAVSNAGPQRDRSRVLIRKDPNEPGELKITELSSSVPWVAAEATRLEEPRPAADGLPAGRPGDWLLAVNAVEPVRYERRRTEIKFKTGLQRQAEMTVPVMVDLRPPVNVSMREVRIQPPRDGSPSTATVAVSLRRGLEGPLAVEVEPELLSVELVKTGPRFYKAHVSWEEGELATGSIVFSVGEERVSVPVVPAAAAPASKRPRGARKATPPNRRPDF